MVGRGMKQPIPFLLFGLLLVPSAPIPGRTLVSVPATDTPLTFEPPPNGIVVAAGVTLNTRLEPIDAQTPPREESNRDPRLRIDSPRDGAVVASGETLQVAVSSPNRTRFVGIMVVMADPIRYRRPGSDLAACALRDQDSEGHLTRLIPVTAVAGLAGRAGRDGELVVAVIEVDIERREMPRAITAAVTQFNFEKKGQTRESSSLAILETVISSM